MLVVSIQGNFFEAKHEILLAEKKGGEVIELRLDLMQSLHLSQIAILRKLSSLPIIFTIKTPDAKEALNQHKSKKLPHFLDLVRLHPDYIDIESNSKWIHAIPPHIKTIISYHNFETTPDNLDYILDRLTQYPAQVYKIATFAHSSIDALRMLSFVKRHSDSSIAGMCLGEFGTITRILAPVVGSVFTYTFLEKPTAPGQLSISELINLYQYPNLNMETQIYGVIGHPLDQSVGPLFHNAYFARLKKNSVYVKIPLHKDQITSFFTEIKDLPFLGLSVTMPLKESILCELDKVDFEATAIGAVNTLIKKKGKWIGTNTDGKGALDALEKKRKVANQTVLIIGSGGVARAIGAEARKRGAHVLILSRCLEKGETMATQIGGRAISSEEIESYPYDIVINATPIGMGPLTGERVLCETKIRKNVLGLDVVIHSQRTPFLRSIERKGGAIVLGIDMYVQQALEQLKVWSFLKKEDRINFKDNTRCFSSVHSLF